MPQANYNYNYNVPQAQIPTRPLPPQIARGINNLINESFDLVKQNSQGAMHT